VADGTSETEIRAYGSIASIPKETWNGLVGDAMPFLEWDWLALLEETKSVSPDSGWLPRHVVIYDGGEAVAACPAYLKGHSMGEFVYDWSWANAARQIGVPYYPKLIAAVPFTPATGQRLLIAPGQDRALRTRELAGALHAVADASKAAGIHVLFCTEEESTALTELGAMERLQHQYHWKNPGYADFDDYLSRFRSRRRKEIRRERKGALGAGLRIEALQGEQITREVLEEFYLFYRNTCDRYGGWDYLSRGMWEKLPTAWPDRVVLFSAWEGDRLRAGAFCVRKNDRMYGRYWGHQPGWQPPKFLHFELCFYAPIEFAIREGVRLFEPGQGGHHKFSRGFEPELCRSAHWLMNDRLRRPIEDFVIRERDEVRARVAGMLEESPIRPKED